MATPAHQIQGSQAWHEYRASKGNASEVAALLGCSPFYPRNAAELFDVKTGRKAVYENAAMRRGTQLEEPARAYMEVVLERSFSPHVCERDRLSASLDGIDLDETMILELKVPAKGAESDTWKHVEKHNAPPNNYWWQVQQQILCSGVNECVFAVCAADEDGNILDSIHCTVTADHKAHERIEKEWAWFLQKLDADERPEDDKPEVVEREDDEWQQAAEDFRAAKQALEKAKAEEERARKTLLELAGDQSAHGAGVKISRMYVKGSIDYKAAVPKDIDLEPYRKSGRWQARIDLESK